MLLRNALLLLCALTSAAFNVFPTNPFSPSPRLKHPFTFPSTSVIGTTTSLYSTVERQSQPKSPSPPRKIINDVKGTYRNLADGCVSIQQTPTIQFKYTSPVADRDTFQEVIESALKSQSDDPNTRKDDMQTVRLLETIKATHQNSKPVLLYLPGLDGVGISATVQFDDLSDKFEFWRMSIDQVNDRSSFHDLTTAVTSFLDDVALKQNREVILVGESFGGLLAPGVAMRMKAIAKAKSHDSSGEVMEIKNPIKGIAMVNPATSFEKTNWSTLAPILASLRHIEQEEEEGRSLSLPTPYSVIGGMVLAATIPDSSQFRDILKIFTDTKVETSDELQDILKVMRDGFGILADNLPAEVIEHRVGQWLPVGCDVVNPRLHQLDVPVLVVAGEEDNMVPSKDECDRLVNVIPNCTGMYVKETGHFILDNRFNLTEAIVDALDPFDAKKNEKVYDPILDWEPPVGEALREAVDNRVKPFRTLASPKFFSTGRDGKRRLGLGQVPKTDGPLLFVANHQLLGLDLGMIIAELLEQREIAARGLAHPVVFQGGGVAAPGPQRKERITKRNKEGPIDPPMSDFQTFGAVMVTPKNYYRLMQTGQTGLLFPGGVREVFHGKDEAYELFWPEKVDFVRIAARFNATIIPISAIGAADSANILLDAPEVLNLPFGLGERALNNSQSVISARFDQDTTDELFQPPIVVPKLTPARHYFIFGQPFDTSSIHHADKDACADIYHDIKSELRRGLDDLLEAREKDPYKDFAQRLAVEQLSGKPAPTFPLSELNK